MGIDPGSKSCGYAIVEREGTEFRFIESGAIRPGTNLPIHERLHIIGREISLKIEHFSPTCMSIEKVFVAKSVKSAIHLGQARGAVLMAAGGREICVYEYSSTAVKKSVTSNGRASKEEVQKMLSLLTGGKNFDSTDESDAVAVAICHINNIKITNRWKIPDFGPRKSPRRRLFSKDDFPAERKSS